MPRFFFRIAGEHDHFSDEGVVLADVETARSQAVIAAGEMLKDIDGRFWSAPEWRMHVVDEQGRTVCLLTIRGSAGEEDTDAPG